MLQLGLYNMAQDWKSDQQLTLMKSRLPEDMSEFAEVNDLRGLGIRMLGSRKYCRWKFYSLRDGLLADDNATRSD